ncbi:hypothetical protein HHK36_031931 [Tetracentron sinense]|uniref:phosphoribosylaminoimidazolesuccinocarboxamide synthase n=1 Tax=Tetracentron sinense TaxID=13715 RepID=A0A834YBL4_TETSI|nr:hypothetical protein HHK36_031931 [Tetracentron sinense]
MNSKASSLLPSFPAISYRRAKARSKGLPTISLSVSSGHQQQQPPLDILTSSNRREDVLNAVRGSLSNCLSETNLHQTVPGLKSKTRGKVRDVYDVGDYLVLVTTDRQSAFDRVLASIPFKGQILNETSLWWFDKTQHIVPNAVVLNPDRNVTIAKKCSVFPVEFVAAVECSVFQGQQQLQLPQKFLSALYIGLKQQQRDRQKQFQLELRGEREMVQ